MRILGIDPGTTRCGFGIIDLDDKGGFFAVEFGCIESDKASSDGDRLNKVFLELDGLINRKKPDHIAVESIFFFKNMKTATKIAEARGVILLAAHQNHVETFEYTPLQVKMAVTGYGRSEKKEVQVEVQKALNLEELPKSDDAADALAVAIAHFHKLQELEIGQK